MAIKKVYQVFEFIRLMGANVTIKQNEFYNLYISCIRHKLRL
jgi:hypothetical protein